MGSSALSFGIILLGSENLNQDSFENTLNHEYGHKVHMQQIGVTDYFLTTAIPSLMGAALHKDSFGFTYYDMPWERTADYLGGVNRDYLPNTNKMAAIFWACTLVCSAITPY
jgi:hypothetical protein